MKTKLFISIFFSFLVLVSSLANGSSNPIVLKSDNGNFDGYSANSTTHQVEPKYQIMKIFDISQEDLDGVVEAKVRLYMGLIDFSLARNGFLEDMQLVVNGNIVTVPLDQFNHGKRRGQFPVYEWCDITIPYKYLKAGENKVIVKKAKGTTEDDYVYVAIDNSISYGKSACSMDDGKTWIYEKLNAVNAKGEYMIRLVLYKDKSSQQGTKQVGLLQIAENKKVNLAPKVNQPIGKVEVIQPRVSAANNECIISNGYYSLKLSYASNLVLTEIKSAYTNWENMLSNSDATELFWIKVDNRRISSCEFRVDNMQILTQQEQGTSFDLVYDELSLCGTITLKVDSTNEIRMGLTLRNNGADELEIKTVFPHLGGIIISDLEVDDYYMFPMYGGIISNKASYIHSAYGQTTALWQMVDVYSPPKGSGLYIRIDDTTGIYKAIQLAKGESPDVILANADYRSSNSNISWVDQRMVESSTGTAIAFGYQTYKIKTGENFAYPETVLGVHPGDWQVAMKRYSAWAHETWEWRPYPSSLTDVFHMKFGPGLPEDPLIVNGQWRDIKRSVGKEKDLLELQHWWKWSELGPWSVPLDNDLKTAREMLGDLVVDQGLYQYQKDPITGKMCFINNRGEWGYNEAWGGKEALRNYIDGLKQEGVMVTLYTDPFLVLDPTSFGQEYGAELGVMNPIWYKNQLTKPTYIPLQPEGYYTGSSWQMCVDNQFYQDYFAEKIKNVCRDLGTGIRLDEVGFSRPACYSDKHDHIFAREPGDEATFKAQAELVRKVREAMDEVDPTLVLMAEAPGNDLVMSNMEGTLFYDTRWALTLERINPVVFNIARFYFPECKAIDYIQSGADNKYYEQAFWQAKALAEPTSVYRATYSSAYYNILKENGDAYGGKDLRVFVPTQVEYIYANTFATDNKTLIHFYNDSGKEFKGIVIDVPYEKGYHYFDLINLKEVATCEEENVLLIKTHLFPEKAGCIAKLPCLLTLDKKGNDYFVKIKSDVIGYDESLELKVYDKDHNVIYQSTSCNTENKIPSTIFEAKPSHIKLYQKGYLLDVIALE